MSTRTLRFVFRVAAATFVVASIAVLGWSLQTGDLPPESSASVRRSSTQNQAEGFVRSRTAEDFAPLWKKRLRRPLVDPPQPADTKPVVTVVRRPPSPPPLAVNLLGTALEGDNSLAIFADRQGKLDVKGVGQTLNLTPAGIRVEEIREKEATLFYRGGKQTIELKEPN